MIAHVLDMTAVDPVFLAIANALSGGIARPRSVARSGFKISIELNELSNLSRISQERDLDRLLGLSSRRVAFITGSDASSIYVVDHIARQPSEAASLQALAE